MAQKQPSFYQLALSEAVLEPGDMLYIPPFYFHFAQAMAPGSSQLQCFKHSPANYTGSSSSPRLPSDTSLGGVSVSVSTWSSSLELARLNLMFQDAVPFIRDYNAAFSAEAEVHGIRAVVANFLLLVVMNVAGRGEGEVCNFLHTMVSTRFEAPAGNSDEVCWKGQRVAQDQERLIKMLIPHAQRVAEALTGRKTSESNGGAKGEGARAVEPRVGSEYGKRDPAVGGGISLVEKEKDDEAATLLMLMTYLEKVLSHVLQAREAVPAFLQHCFKS